MTSTYITTTIPYVNARPHLGFALELVQADVLARYRRDRGERVRFQAGTDDNSLKNVLAAQAAGVAVREFVDANAAAFTGLGHPLNLSVDDVIRTSADPRHAPGVERLWQACAARGDLYRRRYEGLYCVGCEQFYPPAELTGGRCPEHGTVPEPVAEENWFFRLSRYAGELRRLVAGGTIRIEPAERRNEVLALIDGGLEDFSVSRSTARARGWGIPVPGDPGQVIYVWWDALGNYLTALGYGSGGPDVATWWDGAARRVHLLGKGVLRFHAVYWPAILLSAGEAVPTDIAVHGYLTENGRKISKSSGATVDPYDLVGAYGTDAVRWWLLREVGKGADADFTVARLVSRANDELANGFGNLVNRVVALIHRCCGGRIPAARGRGGTGGGGPGGGPARRPGPGRRGPGRLRLPPGHRRGLARRGRGEPLRQPHPPVVPRDVGRTGGTGRGPADAAARVHVRRPAAAPVPPGRGGPHHRPAHPGRRRVPPGPGPGLPAAGGPGRRCRGGVYAEAPG